MVFKIYVKIAKINQIHSILYTKVSRETSSGNNSRWEKRKEPLYCENISHIFLFAFKNIFSPASAKLNSKLLSANCDKLNCALERGGLQDRYKKYNETR